jgi:hypothetical protein
MAMGTNQANVRNLKRAPDKKECYNRHDRDTEEAKSKNQPRTKLATHRYQKGHAWLLSHVGGKRENHTHIDTGEVKAMHL